MLGARPVSAVTIKAAHVLCVGLHGGIITLSLALLPAVLGAGMPDAGPWFFPVYVTLSMGLGTLLVLGLLTLGARWRDRSWFHWIQLVRLSRQRLDRLLADSVAGTPRGRGLQ
jgi:hypothetical protein